MFQRYTDEMKRAIYFGAQRARYDGASAIDSSHLLLGLLMDDASRADSVFHLHELLPEETAKQALLKSANIGNRCDLVFQRSSPRPLFGKRRALANEIGLAPGGKKILAYATREANQLRDYWIDTEHLVLGILRDSENAATVRLRSVGLDLESARQRVVENKASRPPRPNPVLFWVRRRPIGFALVVIFLLGIIAGLVFLGFGGLGIAVTIVVLAIAELLRSMARSRSSA
jgi:ATP-dependent Clp protease ATP-binding subunit ClpC